MRTLLALAAAMTLGVGAVTAAPLNAAVGVPVLSAPAAAPDAGDLQPAGYYGDGYGHGRGRGYGRHGGYGRHDGSGYGRGGHRRHGGRYGFGGHRDYGGYVRPRFVRPAYRYRPPVEVFVSPCRTRVVTITPYGRVIESFRGCGHY